jgi:hypothetical protein
MAAQVTVWRAVRNEAFPHGTIIDDKRAADVLHLRS